MKYLTLLLIPLLAAGCANFRKLEADLKMMNEGYWIGGAILNAHDYQVPVRAAVVEWNREKNEVFSGDQMELAKGGAFVFLVKSPLHQHVMAYADMNKDGRYEEGEPFWIHSDASGKPSAVVPDETKRDADMRGRLATGGKFPVDLAKALETFLGGREVSEVITKQGIRLEVGEIAKLDDPKFAATRGEDGLWTPATMAIRSGFGIYFLEPYDPNRIPVLFVHGAAGSPQDWRYAMEKLDPKRYQAWFYFYPSGGRLEPSANALNEGVKLLHDRYGFRRLHVAAHSMGGLVARTFVVKNVIEDRQGYINTFVTFSSPWAGHEAAASGVKWAPSVVPSWRDMEGGSDFLAHLFDQRLKGKVAHHLFYGHHASRKFVLPEENDGTVSVASQLRPEAKADAASVQGYDEDHVSILKSKAALTRAEGIFKKAR